MSQMGQNRNFEGFLVRGAIVREKISHEDQTVFGEALIEAYRLESEVVRFPRVMIAGEVYHDAAVTSSKWSDALRSRIRQADDGPYTSISSARRNPGRSGRTPPFQITQHWARSGCGGQPNQA
jgi:hypothetical protein